MTQAHSSLKERSDAHNESRTTSPAKCKGLDPCSTLILSIPKTCDLPLKTLPCRELTEVQLCMQGQLQGPSHYCSVIV